MNKARLEAFSDGLFAVAMTLLIFEVKTPLSGSALTNVALWQQLLLLWPDIAAYFVSFIVLSAFWINHHFIFHSIAREVDRGLNLLNMGYLMFVVFVPFSAQLLGSFIRLPLAALVYGVNIFIIVLFGRIMTNYILFHPGLLNPELSTRAVHQGRFRGTLTLGCYTLGIISSFFYTPLAVFLYAFPVIFNIVPGTLDLVEKMFGFRL